MVGFDKSVIAAPPFLCCSAQAEEGKNRHDDHDETDKVDDAVHNCLYKIAVTGSACAVRSSFRRAGVIGRLVEVKHAWKTVPLAPFKADLLGPL
ncbi:hypothetical protein [Methylocystis parvus]|uniref:Uncharacterized protein n=1 Tax=Methylocystis parvus TaxID=134 RepID=A0A6B8M306_9HYPH|nr:hypothetical protein [Methylocystis parvus]QGM97291.1 hypothetical protein F7D14_07270 [Methylocystis parvus]WBJ98797.1 hypothetical protein MMG94_12350 [Methylocystis parvus OBBP]